MSATRPGLTSDAIDGKLSMYNHVVLITVLSLLILFSAQAQVEVVMVI